MNNILITNLKINGTPLHILILFGKYRTILIKTVTSIFIIRRIRVVDLYTYNLKKETQQQQEQRST